MDFDLIGAQSASWSWVGAGVSIGGSLLGLVLWRAHPVLGFLGGAAIAGNAYELATRRQSVSQATRNLGTHAAAIAASLSVPAFPALAWIGGAVAADLLLPGTNRISQRALLPAGGQSK